MSVAIRLQQICMIVIDPHFRGEVGGENVEGLRHDRLRWCRPPSGQFFLPQKVLAARFRNRLKTALCQNGDFDSIPREVWRQSWVVDVQPAGTGQTAIKYLAAYVYHTALGSQRILNADNGHVTFKYKDSGDQQWRLLQLPAMEFLRRFLQHVLPKGFRRVRYFGWLSTAAKAKWERILALLDWKMPPAILPAKPSPACPCCQKTLTLIGQLPRAPPRRR
jgi:Putative transposase